mgnify:CR=1 FL=1
MVKQVYQIMEQELLYEDMDASNIDLESALEATTDEWTLDNWDDLDDNLKETFRQHEEFQNMDENAIRQKFNSMDSVSICKIARFLFGWVVKLFKAPLNYMDKHGYDSCIPVPGKGVEVEDTMLNLASGYVKRSIDKISYDDSGMNLLSSYDSSVPTPHGISLSEDGLKIVTASNSTDFLSVINTDSGIASTVSLDPNINDTDPTLVLNRLKPLEIVQKGIYAFVSCTGGEWQNINTGSYENVNGQVQVWNTETLEKVSTYEFSVNSKPWHIDYHPVEDKIYVVLSGLSGGAGAGVACLSFDGASIYEEWSIIYSD